MVLTSSLKVMGMAGLLAAANLATPANALDGRKGLRGYRSLQQICSNNMEGIDGINENGAVCCTAECGQCGGEGCGSVPGLDNTNCCINGVLNNQELCSVAGSAPCVIDSGDGVAAPTPVAATTPAPVG
ncbi:unnamed protein product, partial [Ectocarpus sp. 12 AP-2014]